MQRVFGPVPSRRLGRSIGVNNIPPKVCSYSCVYCQLGRAIEMTAERREFFDPDELAAEAQTHLAAARSRGDHVDYLTVVPDGEPTLDAHLGRLVWALKTLGVPVALITNSSLIGDPAVREELQDLDWISLKVDAADRETWKRVDRPHKSLDFDRMRAGMLEFAESFGGTLTTESMLVDGVNDSEAQIDGIASVLSELEPEAAYISIPTRPPAEKWVKPAPEPRIAYAYSRIRELGVHAENLIGYEGNEFAASGDAREDLLGISAVHPMRHDAVEEILARDNANEALLTGLLDSGELIAVEFSGSTYYVRGFRK
jgi:wyosine [tRNA(Phe)-imidazoG37] synthetase (radical SAM superfamily)